MKPIEPTQTSFFCGFSHTNAVLVTVRISAF